MKFLVTKCVCDVCGREINPSEERCMVAFGIGNWDNDDMKMSFEKNSKDVCRNCYLTMLALVNGDETQPSFDEPKTVATAPNNNGDKDQIVYFWKKGLTYKEICKKTGCTIGIVNKTIHKAIQAGEVRDKALLPTKTQNSEPTYKTVVDENGLVLSMERV